jgi:acetylornithine deacetylase/succinyl-diaminopimelate desuccinylase-like protein
MLDTVLVWVDKNEKRWLGDLKGWLAIPSVSAQPEHAGDVKAAAEWTKDYLRTMGMSVELVPTEGHPCVIATTPAGTFPEGSPHVLVYGHYDVQPAEPLELWTSGAFSPTVRPGGVDNKGQLFARGASDDKGQIHCHLAALLAWKEINSGWPCRITVIVEGEEEIGSAHLMGVVNSRRDLLKDAQTLLISDTNMFAAGVPSITYGLRGVVGMEIVLHGASTDLHSGMYGGTVANPAHALCEMISKLHDAQGRVSVPGFYEGVPEVTATERAMWATLPHDDAKYAKELGVNALFGEAGYSTLERKWARPTLEINGLTSGYQGTGGKTVLPNRASAKITCRLVPGQDAEQVGILLENYLRSIVPPGVRIEVLYRSKGSPPAITPLDSPAMKAASAAMELAFGKKPVMQREGGSIPVVAWFKESLGVDTVLMGFGLPDDRIHAPDEKLDVSCYLAGIKACCAIYDYLGSAKADAQERKTSL